MADEVIQCRFLTFFGGPEEFSYSVSWKKDKKANFLENNFFSSKVKSAFTLIELLITISIIFLLIGVLFPVLGLVRARSHQLLCQGNLRQLVLANVSYANEHRGSFMPGSIDIFTENKHRWYGVRNNIDEPFDISRGLLVKFLGRKDMHCPVSVDYLKQPPSDPEYDAGSGGYGYNMVYIGSRIWSDGYDERSCTVTAKDVHIRKPEKTLMFADTAMAKFASLTEYSFAEPRFFLIYGRPNTAWDPSPSIHFRHLAQANVGWADAHVGSQKMGQYDGVNEDGTKPSEMNLGWFEPMDNSMFDLE